MRRAKRIARLGSARAAFRGAREADALRRRHCALHRRRGKRVDGESVTHSAAAIALVVTRLSASFERVKDAQNKCSCISNGGGTAKATSDHWRQGARVLVNAQNATTSVQRRAPEDDRIAKKLRKRQLQPLMAPLPDHVVIDVLIERVADLGVLGLMTMVSHGWRDACAARIVTIQRVRRL